MASVPANISEGSGHESQAQFNRFLGIALASAREADYHLLLSRDLGVIDEVNYADFLSRLGEVQAMLCGLRRRVREQR
jgi:four helix bundle protein